MAKCQFCTLFISKGCPAENPALLLINKRCVLHDGTRMGNGNAGGPATPAGVQHDRYVGSLAISA